MLPVIKYNGGKRREIKFFEHWIPKEFDTYIEPFFGGGALFFHLEPKKSIINDLNPVLMDFYKHFSLHREELLKELSHMKNENDFYYIVRDMLNKKIDREFSQAALYFYINRTTFSGMICYNSKGEFNVPFGRYKTFTPEKFLTEGASNLLKSADIRSDDFEDIFAMASEDDFIFLDPPYDSVFNAYNPIADFTRKDHLRLFECFKNNKAKCLLVISEEGIIRDLYKDYIKEEYEKSYSMNIKNRMKENNTTKHLIITNYDI